MAKISSYNIVTATASDIIIGSDAEQSNATKNFTAQSVANLANAIVQYTYGNITSDTTLTTSSYTLQFVNTSAQNINITLPNAALMPGQIFIFVPSSNSFIVTLLPYGSQTINDAANFSPGVSIVGFTVLSNGSNWDLVDYDSVSSITGSGTINKIPIFNSSSSIADSIMTGSATEIIVAGVSRANSFTGIGSGANLFTGSVIYSPDTSPGALGFILRNTSLTGVGYLVLNSDDTTSTFKSSNIKDKLDSVGTSGQVLSSFTEDTTSLTPTSVITATTPSTVQTPSTTLNLLDTTGILAGMVVGGDVGNSYIQANTKVQQVVNGTTLLLDITTGPATSVPADTALTFSAVQVPSTTLEIAAVNSSILVGMVVTGPSGYENYIQANTKVTNVNGTTITLDKTTGPSSDVPGGVTLTFTVAHQQLKWVAQSGGIGGGGTINKISKWSTASTLTDSLITDDGTTITLGGAVVLPAVASITSATSLKLISTTVTLENSLGSKLVATFQDSSRLYYATSGLNERERVTTLFDGVRIGSQQSVASNPAVYHPVRFEQLIGSNPNYMFRKQSLGVYRNAGSSGSLRKIYQIPKINDSASDLNMSATLNVFATDNSSDTTNSANGIFLLTCAHGVGGMTTNNVAFSGAFSGLTAAVDSTTSSSWNYITVSSTHTTSGVFFSVFIEGMFNEQIYEYIIV